MDFKVSLGTVSWYRSSYGTDFDTSETARAVWLGRLWRVQGPVFCIQRGRQQAESPHGRRLNFLRLECPRKYVATTCFSIVFFAKSNNRNSNRVGINFFIAAACPQHLCFKDCGKRSRVVAAMSTDTDVSIQETGHTSYYKSLQLCQVCATLGVDFRFSSLCTTPRPVSWLLLQSAS